MKPYVPQTLPIENLRWEQLIPEIALANRALAYYEGGLQSISNQDLFLSPLTTQEAVLSSKIEGTQATLGDVLRFEAGEIPVEEHQKQDIHEIINYRRALFRAVETLKQRPLSLNLIRQLHHILLGGVRGENKARGEFRRVQNWIGPPRSTMEEAYFVPPAPQNLMTYLDNWEKYYHSDTHDQLVQLGIVHAQFEIIHPFLDGNGRVGRMLVPLFLHEKKILSKPTFYLSEYFEKNRDEYYMRLRALSTESPDWEGWLTFFLQAIREQAKNNTDRVRSILRFYDELKEQIVEITHSQYGILLLDKMFKRPVFQISDFIGKRMPSRPMLTLLITRLRNAGILQVLREGSGRRGQVLVLRKLIDIAEGRTDMN